MSEEAYSDFEKSFLASAEVDKEATPTPAPEAEGLKPEYSAPKYTPFEEEFLKSAEVEPEETNTFEKKFVVERGQEKEALDKYMSPMLREGADSSLSIEHASPDAIELGTNPPSNMEDTFVPMGETELKDFKDKQEAIKGTDEPWYASTANAVKSGWLTAQRATSAVLGVALPYGDGTSEMAFGLPGQVDVQAELSKEIAAIPTDQSTQEFSQLLDKSESIPDFGYRVIDLAAKKGALGTAKMGAEILMTTGAQSSAMFLPPALAMSYARLPAPVSGFLTSFALESSSQFLDTLQSNGVDITNADSLQQALDNPKLVAKARNEAIAKGIPVAVFDALTFGFAGKYAKAVYKQALKRFGKNMAGRVTGYVAAGAPVIGASAVAGATGEALSQLSQSYVATGKPRIYDRFGVLAEAIGEVAGPMTGSLIQETAPNLGKLTGFSEGVSSYLKEVAPKTWKAVSGQTNEPPVQSSSQAAEELSSLISSAVNSLAFQGADKPVADSPEEDLKPEQVEANKEEQPARAPIKAESGVTSDELISGIVPEEAKAEPSSEIPPAASPEQSYPEAMDYLIDYYRNVARPKLISAGDMEENEAFPKTSTIKSTFDMLVQGMEGAPHDFPVSSEEQVSFLRGFVNRFKQENERDQKAKLEPQTEQVAEEKPEPEETPVTALRSVEALQARLSGSGVEKKAEPSRSKTPKRGEKVTGEITLPQEDPKYIEQLNVIGEAPGEEEALKKAEKVFTKGASSIKKAFPDITGFDESRLVNAARLRFLRQYRLKHKRLAQRGNIKPSEVAERFLSDIAPGISTSRIFRSTAGDYLRKLHRRLDGRVGLEATRSLDQALGPDDSESTLYNTLAEEDSNAETEREVLEDLGRNARNKYFLKIGGDLTKQLLLRASLNKKDGHDISKDMSRLSKIRDALAATGLDVSIPELQKELEALMQDFRSSVSAQVVSQLDRYRVTGEMPEVVDGPEAIRSPAFRKQNSAKLSQDDIQSHAETAEAISKLHDDQKITDQQLALLEDILDESPRKSSALRALTELRAILASVLPEAPLEQMQVKAVSNNPNIEDATPKEFNLMGVQRSGATMIYNAYLRGLRGVLLADSAGLGKTRTALAAARMIADAQAKRLSKISGEEEQSGKIIYITESHELINAAMGGAKAQLSAGNIPNNRVFFKTYDELSKGKINFEDADVVIFDEGQNLKNPESERSRLSQIGQAFHIYVSATPADKVRGIRYFLSRITNRPAQEIEEALTMSQNPSSTIFSYLDAASENFGYIRREPVAQITKPVLVQVSLGDVLGDLQKIDNYHRAKLENVTQRQLRSEITDDQANLEKLKISSDLKRSTERWLEISKAEEVYQLAKEAIANGRQVIIFGESVNETIFPELHPTNAYPSLIEIVKARLAEDGIPAASIYGEGGEQMTSEINDFQAGRLKVALATPYKGGSGLSLDDQLGGQPRTVINATINEAADKDEQMKYRGGNRLSSKSELQYYELYAPEAASDRTRMEGRTLKQKILRATQGSGEIEGDDNQTKLNFTEVIKVGQAPEIVLPAIDPSQAPQYSSGGTVNTRLQRQFVDDRISSLPSAEREVVSRLAESIDQLGFKGVKIVFAAWSGKAAWADPSQGEFDTIFVNPSILELSHAKLGGLNLGSEYLRAVAVEEIHHNSIYKIISKASLALFSEQKLLDVDSFRRTYSVMMRGVYDEISPEQRARTIAEYGKPLSPELIAIEYLRSLYQEIKLGYTSEDLVSPSRRLALAEKLKGVPRDGLVRMWLEACKKAIFDLLSASSTSFLQSPLLSNMLEASDIIIQNLTDNGPPLDFSSGKGSYLYSSLAKHLGVTLSTQAIQPGKVDEKQANAIGRQINQENAKPVAVVDGVLMSDVSTFVEGLDGRTYPAKYAWVQSTKLVASHTKDFSSQPRYPFRNNRDYSNNKQEQDKVLDGASNFKPFKFVNTAKSANGGLQTVIRGIRTGDFFLLAGNGRNLISELAFSMPLSGQANLEDLIGAMVETSVGEGVPVPENVQNYRLVRVLDSQVDETSTESIEAVNDQIANLNDAGGRQTTALGKAEQDLKPILNNSTMAGVLERFATGETPLTPYSAVGFVQSAVENGVINRLERGFLADPSERLAARAYVRYLLARTYANPTIEFAAKGVDPQVVFALEVMNLSDANWALASRLLRVNALSANLGQSGDKLKKVLSQFLYRLVMQPGEEKNDFITLVRSFGDKVDELSTLMATADDQLITRLSEKFGDLFEKQLISRIGKNGKVQINVAKSRSRIFRMVDAMGDDLVSGYKEQKLEESNPGLGLDVAEVDPIDYMLEVMNSRLLLSPDMFNAPDGDDDYSAAASPEIEDEEAFADPSGQELDEQSEQAVEGLAPIIEGEELQPETLALKNYVENGQADYGFKSRVAYNKLLSALDSFGYSKYLKLRKVLEMLSTDAELVDEIAEAIDKELELREGLAGITGVTAEAKKQRLRMALPSKDETFEMVRALNVTTRDGRVAQLLEPIVSAIKYPTFTAAQKKQSESAVAMFVEAQRAVEKLLKAKELSMLRSRPAFMKATNDLLEGISESYQQFIREESVATPSERPFITDNGILRPMTLDEWEASQKKEVKKPISKAKKDAFYQLALEAERARIDARAIAEYTSKVSIDSKIKLAVENIVELRNDVSKGDRAAITFALKLRELNQKGSFLGSTKDYAKKVVASQNALTQKLVHLKRAEYVLAELDRQRSISLIQVSEKIDIGHRLSDAEIKNLTDEERSEMDKRGFVYAGAKIVRVLNSDLAPNRFFSSIRFDSPTADKSQANFPINRGVISWTLGDREISANIVTQKLSGVSLILSYNTKSGPVKLPTFTDGSTVSRSQGQAAASAYYGKSGALILTRQQIAGEAPNIVRITPTMVSLRDAKLWSPATEKTKTPKFDLPKAKRFTREEAEVNDRGERWYEFTLDPENRKTHQRTYVRALNALEAIRASIKKLAETGSVLFYKGRGYSIREASRTVTVPIDNEATADTESGLSNSELALRKAIRNGEVETVLALITEGKASRDNIYWLAKQEVEATIVGMYEAGADLQDTLVINLAREFGFIDLSGKNKPDLGRLRKMKELAMSSGTPKSMIAGKEGRGNVIRDVSENLRIFGTSRNTKKVPAPEQVYYAAEGESTLDIAKKYNISREELMKANGFAEDHNLQPGESIKIPETGYSDTTEDLILKLYKDKVHERGVTMLRVNTPPPNVHLRNDYGEPAASPTIGNDDTLGLFRNPEYGEAKATPVGDSIEIPNPNSKTTRVGMVVNYNNALALLLADKLKISPVESVIKEAIQNALDATKAMGGLEHGSIHVEIDAKKKTISVTDNGIGMTPEMINENMFGLFNPNKEVAAGEASGGFGRGIKEAMVAGEVFVKTVRDGYTSIVNSTPEQMFSEDLDKRPQIVTSKNPRGSTETGTVIRVKFRDTLSIPGKSAVSIPLRFPYGMPDILSKPMIGNVEVTWSDGQGTLPRVAEGVGLSFEKSWRLLEGQPEPYSWGSADYYVQKKDRENYLVVNVLSAGVFQFHMMGYDLSNLTGLKSEVISEALGKKQYTMNVRPMALPGDINYPFAPNRESFNSLVKDDVGAFFRTLVNSLTTKNNTRYNDNLYKYGRVVVGGQLEQSIEKITDPRYPVVINETFGAYETDEKEDALLAEHAAIIQEWTMSAIPKAYKNTFADENGNVVGSLVTGKSWNIGSLVSAQNQGVCMRIAGEPMFLGVLVNPFSNSQNINAGDVTEIGLDGVRRDLNWDSTDRARYAARQWAILLHELGHVRTFGLNRGVHSEAQTAQEQPGLTENLLEFFPQFAEKMVAFYDKHLSVIQSASASFKLYKENNANFGTDPNDGFGQAAGSPDIQSEFEYTGLTGEGTSESKSGTVSKPEDARNEGVVGEAGRNRVSGFGNPGVEKVTWSLALPGYPRMETEALSKKASIGNNLSKLFKKYGVLSYRGEVFTPSKLGVLHSLLARTSGWSSPVNRVSYGPYGTRYGDAAAAPEIGDSDAELTERIYQARHKAYEREGKSKVRGFVKRYGKDNEIHKDLKNVYELNKMRTTIRTQPIRAEEAMRLIKEAGGALAVAAELIAPEIHNKNIAKIAVNPIEYDNLAILNSIVIRQLDQLYRTALASGNKDEASLLMNLSLQMCGKQAELGTKLGRGLAAFAAYARLSPAGWRYMFVQQFEQARHEQLGFKVGDFDSVTSMAGDAVRIAFEKVIAKPENKKLLDTIDKLADSKMWSALLVRAKKIATLAKAAGNVNEADYQAKLKEALGNAKELISMIKAQKDDLENLQLESAISKGVATALLSGISSSEDTAKELGITEVEVLQNSETAQDSLDETRKDSVRVIRAKLPEDMKDKALGFLFQGEEPSPAGSPEKSIEDGEDPEEELQDSEEFQFDKLLTKFIKDLKKSLDTLPNEAKIPKEKTLTIIRRILREGVQQYSPGLKLKRSTLSREQKKRVSINRFRQAIGEWEGLTQAFDRVKIEIGASFPAGEANLILDAVDSTLEKPYTAADIKSFLALSNSDIRSFLFSRKYKLSEKAGEVLQDLLSNLAANGVQVPEKLLASVLTNISEEIKQVAQAEFVKELGKETQSGVGQKKVYEQKANEIVKLALLGRLDRSSLFQATNKALGLDEEKWSPSDKSLSEVTKLADSIANDPDGPNSLRSARTTIAMLDIIRKEVGVNIGSALQAFFYINIIGGLRTVTLNIFAPISNALHFSFYGFNKTDRNSLKQGFRHIKSAFNQGLTEFLNVIATGDIAGKVTLLEGISGSISNRKYGKGNMELFLDDQTELRGWPWAVKLFKLYFGVGGKGLSITTGIPQSVWEGAFKLFKTSAANKLFGNIKTPEYDESAKAHLSITGLGVLLGRLYSGIDVLATTVYSEIHAGITAYELADNLLNIESGGRGSSEDARVKKADAILGYDVGTQLKVARSIVRSSRDGKPAAEGRETPALNPVIEQLQNEANEQKLPSLKPGSSDFRRQFYNDRIRNRAYSGQLSAVGGELLSNLDAKGLAERERQVRRYNDDVNKLIWQSLWMGQWMAQVNQPYGVVGGLAKAMESVANKYPSIRYAQPFFSIVSNVYTMWLNWCGAGLIKNGFNENSDSRKYMDVAGHGKVFKPSAQLKYERGAGIAGAVTLASFLMFTVASIFRNWGDDDEKKEESWFDLTGSGPKSIDERKNLEATKKWQKDSIKIGPLWIKNPTWLPMYQLIKTMGDMRDYTKYEMPQHSNLMSLGLDFAASMMATFLKGPLDVPFLSGAKTLMEGLNTDNPRWFSKLSSIALRAGSSIVSPGIVREFDARVVDPVVREKSGSVIASLIGNLPFARSFGKPLTNQLGEPVTFANMPQDRGYGVSSLLNYLEIFASPRAAGDPLFEKLAARNAWLTSPPYRVQVKGITLNEEERDVWFMERARVLSGYLRKPETLGQIDKMSPGEAQDMVSKLTSYAQSSADGLVLQKYNLSDEIQKKQELIYKFGARGAK